MIWLQVITIFFAIACAWLNKWPVIVFRAQIQQGHKSEKEFHAANAVVKVLWAVTLAYLSGVYLSAVIFLLICWLVFDISLNLFTSKPWHYLGQTAWLDKMVKNGKIKSAVVLVIIIALNFLL